MLFSAALTRSSVRNSSHPPYQGSSSQVRSGWLRHLLAGAIVTTYSRSVLGADSCAGGYAEREARQASWACTVHCCIIIIAGRNCHQVHPRSSAFVADRRGSSGSRLSSLSTRILHEELLLCELNYEAAVFGLGTRGAETGNSENHTTRLVTS